jgi:hypothetical protein
VPTLPGEPPEPQRIRVPYIGATLRRPMPSRCCRSSPRCADCPVVVAAVARRRRQDDLVATLVDEVFAGACRRSLPEAVARTLQTLDVARHAGRTAARA